MCRYEKYMVAYLDLLGASHNIKADSNGEYLRTVYQCYAIASKAVDYMSNTVTYPFQSKIFSDNIVIALPCNETEMNDNHPIIALNRMTAIIGALQRNFLEHDILSRGSIAYRDLFIDDLMVFGNALIQAYELESGVANFPRVVFSKQVQEFDVEVELEGSMVSANKLRRDSDGIFFLDYLDYPDDESVQALVAKSIQWVTDKIVKESNVRILQKLGWHKNYLESVLRIKKGLN